MHIYEKSIEEALGKKAIVGVSVAISDKKKGMLPCSIRKINGHFIVYHSRVVFD